MGETQRGEFKRRLWINIKYKARKHLGEAWALREGGAGSYMFMSKWQIFLLRFREEEMSTERVRDSP